MEQESMSQWMPALLAKASENIATKITNSPKCYDDHMPASSPIYQLKISIKGITPPIWRRILIPGSATFRDLHEAIQLALGWSDCHLHDFSTKKRAGMYIEGKIADLTVPDAMDDPWDEKPAEERKVKLQERLPKPGDRIAYSYDFGDSWEHEILLEKIIEREKDIEYPICVGGKRACPPEDCGGLGGYDRLLAILADPKHKEHEEMLEWLGLENADDFDPEEFDIDTTNELLRDGY